MHFDCGAAFNVQRTFYGFFMESVRQIIAEGVNPGRSGARDTLKEDPPPVG